MTEDPMDRMPVDYGSDRYDMIVITAPAGMADECPSEFASEYLEPCLDCRANVFIEWVPGSTDPKSRSSWRATIAHDDGCPTLRKIEGPS